MHARLTHVAAAPFCETRCGYVLGMSDVAREMIRTYFGITGTDSNLRLQKIRELRERDGAAGRSAASGTAGERRAAVRRLQRL